MSKRYFKKRLLKKCITQFILIAKFVILDLEHNQSTSNQKMAPHGTL